MLSPVPQVMQTISLEPVSFILLCIRIACPDTNAVNTILTRIYGADFLPKNYSQTLTSIAFAGTIVGMLTFGYLSDKFGRKFGMVRMASGSCISRDI